MSEMCSSIEVRVSFITGLSDIAEADRFITTDVLGLMEEGSFEGWGWTGGGTLLTTAALGGVVLSGGSAT